MAHIAESIGVQILGGWRMHRFTYLAIPLLVVVLGSTSSGCEAPPVVEDDGGDTDEADVCPPGLDLCAGACVNLRNDAAFCGTCETSCAEGEICAAGTCDLFCPAGLERCDDRCVDTTYNPAFCGGCATSCSAGEVCSEGLCVASCSAGLTNCAGACVNVRNDDEFCGDCNTACGLDESCEAGVCEATLVAGCPAGFTDCDGACKDLLTDPGFCGDCATSCSAGEVCSEGSCATFCPAGQTECDGACVNTLTDPGYCGDCATSCSAGEVCSEGSCASFCPAGQTDCNGACVNTLTDPGFCGDCATSCSAGEVCNSGTCASFCPPGQTDCNGACVDLQTHPSFCGDCETTCAATEVCGGGVCATFCPAGQTECDGSCVDLQTHPNFCGDCETSCSLGQQCSQGACLDYVNGVPVADPWGETWDSLSRSAKTWAEANADCESLGGRLPSATELYRNRASPGGSGAIASSSDTPYLWTLIADETVNNRVAVRLSDGVTSAFNASTAQTYRCVFHNTDNPGFSGDDCYGAPGAECQAHNRWANVDTLDRPALSFAAAVNECALYGASVTTLRDFSSLAQDGWQNPTNAWLWMSETKYWYNGNYGYTLGRWSQDPEPAWSYDAGTRGSLSLGMFDYGFRCIGKRSDTDGVLPSAPACSGSCFTIDTAKARMIMDDTDRAAASEQEAQSACRALGGKLPTSDELTSMIHAGLPNPTDAWLWVNEPVYWYNGAYGYVMLRFDGSLGEHWSAGSGRMGLSYPQDARNFRCLWNETLSAGPLTTCAAAENQDWDGTGFGCSPAVDGDSGGNANPFETADGWGNAWDLIERTAATFNNARQTCESLGGRLPTPTELYRVRHQPSPLDITLGDATSTNYVWTLAPYSSTQRVTLRLSDGAVSSSVEALTAPYRCVWPTTKGNTFAGRSCFGEPSAPCFQSDRLRTDRYDRTPMPAHAAAWECRFFGGELATAEEFQDLVHAGAPNGSDAWLWMNRPLYWYSGGYGYALGKWAGTGTTAWGYHQTGDGTLGVAADLRGFRCTFSDRMK